MSKYCGTKLEVITTTNQIRETQHNKPMRTAFPQAQETMSGQVTTVFIFCESDWFEDTGKAFKN